MLVQSPVICVGFDTETHLIGAGNLFPRLVCATFDAADQGKITPSTDVRDTFRAWIVGNGDGDGQTLLENLLPMWQGAHQGTHRIIIQEAAYDICVVLAYCKDVISGDQRGDQGRAKELYMLIWDVMEKGLDLEMAGYTGYLHDTILRSKLHRLSTIGMIERTGREGYTLADLVMEEFQIDISGGKVSTDQAGRVFDHSGKDITGTAAAASSWRLRYSELDSKPTSEWPPEAVQYAIDDATWARKLFEVGEVKRQPVGYGSMNSEALQVYAATALRLYQATGFQVDRAKVTEAAVKIDEVVKRCNEGLRLNGVVRPNGSVHEAVLHERIKAAWKVKGKPPVLTPNGQSISAAGEILEELAGIDPIVDLYAERQGFSKLQNAFLPNLSESTVYSNYDVLKETGRTSSYGNSDKAKRKPLYNAVNIQQIPRSDGIRECFLPPPASPAAPKGYVMCSCDYSALELCSVAQVTYSLLGYSVHRDKINAGYDLHTYLGSAMARSLAPHVVGYATDHEAAYQALLKGRKAKVSKKPVEGEDPAVALVRALKEDCGTWRNFAKPVGLGYPGGLGPATLVTFAKATYGIVITEEQSQLFRELWRQTYPEMVEFKQWVEKQGDMQWGSGSDLYCYETQGFGRYRAAATFCATMNGKSMQSLSADGAKRGVCWIARSHFGGLEYNSPYSLLDGCLPQAFIHDENLTAIPDDDLLTVRSLLTSKLMVRAMQIHMPDVKASAEPALMRRWTKAAEAEWRSDPGALDRMLDALTRFGQDRGVRGFADIVADELGPAFDPTQVLVPWDDVYMRTAS